PLERAVLIAHGCPCLGCRDVVQLVEGDARDAEEGQAAVNVALRTGGGATERLAAQHDSARESAASAQNLTDEELAALVVARGVDERNAGVEGRLDGRVGLLGMRG